MRRNKLAFHLAHVLNSSQVFKWSISEVNETGNMSRCLLGVWCSEWCRWIVFIDKTLAVINAYRIWFWVFISTEMQDKLFMVCSLTQFPLFGPLLDFLRNFFSLPNFHLLTQFKTSAAIKVPSSHKFFRSALRFYFSKFTAFSSHTIFVCILLFVYFLYTKIN